MPSQLTADCIHRVVATWRPRFAQHTRSTYTKCLRRFIHWLERVAAAPPTLSDAVPRVHQPQPRTTIATDQERRQLLEAASPSLRFFLLLCADLGLRHRTAARITPANYDPHLRAVSFYTKGNVHQTLPVSAEIAAIFEALPRHADRHTPVVNLLRPDRPGTKPGPNPRFTKQWNALKRKAGIRADLRVHDLRRTVAEDVWSATHDLRAVQAQLGHRSPTTTARYLADRISLQDLQPILRKVQQLRALRESSQVNSDGNCNTCAAATHCTSEARLCERKEFDA
ncbi:MAG TPA: tyrosine-type recombinase/integrase [Terriglobales bacterium]|nr:tyrosine-type recombinase/integrase [Terriglobales bacterium]